MQIILLEKVANLGQLGDVVKVKDGYARNFLIPQKKAKRATQVNLAEFESRRAELEKAQAELIEQAEQRAKDLENFTFSIAQKAGVDGRLFGSVTTNDIALALTKAGKPTSKAEIRLPDGPFKSTGKYSIEIALHHDVLAKVNLEIVPEN